MKKFHHRNVIIILLCICLFQFWDLQEYLSAVREKFNGEVQTENVLNSAAWEEIARNKQAMIFLNSSPDDLKRSLYTTMEPEQIFELSQLALNHGLYLNDFYVSRVDQEAIGEQKEIYLQEIFEAGSASAEYVYIFDRFPLFYFTDEALNFYCVDDIYVGLKEELTGTYENCTPLHQGDGIDLMTGMWFSDRVVSGEQDPTRRLGYKGKAEKVLQVLEKGQYQVIVTGQKLNDLKVEVTVNGESQTLTEVSRTEEQVVVQFEFENRLGNIGVVLYNGTFSYLPIKSATLYKINEIK